MTFVRNIPAHLDKHCGHKELMKKADHGIRNVNTAWGGDCLGPVPEGSQRGRRQPCDRAVRIGQISSPHSQCGTVYHYRGVAPTICACTHGYAIYHILVRTEI